MHEHDQAGSADVLIIGAGIAGLSLATALGRQGFRVSVIDGASRPEAPKPGKELQDWDLRGQRLNAGLYRVPRGDWGFGEDASTHRAAPYDCMRVWDASGSGSIVFDAGEADASSLGHIVENREILQALLQCAQALPCVELCWGSCARDNVFRRVRLVSNLFDRARVSHSFGDRCGRRPIQSAAIAGNADTRMELCANCDCCHGGIGPWACSDVLASVFGVRPPSHAAIGGSA